MPINIVRRERTKNDYLIAAIGAGVSFALSIASLVIYIKESN